MISQKISDEELVLLLQEKETNEAAFALLIDRHSQKLYSVIRRILLSHQDTNDVLQATFIKVWQKIDTFEGKSKLSTWMYTIATNEALSFLRKKKRDRSVPLATNDYDLTDILVSDPYFDGTEAEAKFMAAIEELPEKQKLTFQLRYFEDLPYKEISEITGTSEGALKANYHHALKKLKNYLGINIDEKD